MASSLVQSALNSADPTNRRAFASALCVSGLLRASGQNRTADRGDDFPSAGGRAKQLRKRFSRQKRSSRTRLFQGLYLAPASVHTTRRNAESYRPPRHGWTPPREERSGLPIGSHSAATV